jgi:hypothetical protein
MPRRRKLSDAQFQQLRIETGRMGTGSDAEKLCK